MVTFIVTTFAQAQAVLASLWDATALAANGIVFLESDFVAAFPAALKVGTIAF